MAYIWGDNSFFSTPAIHKMINKAHIVFYDGYLDALHRPEGTGPGKQGNGNF